MTERLSSADMTVHYIEAVISTMRDASPATVVDPQVPIQPETIESLDRAAFPTVEDVQSGVPTGYLPHGFTDMGGVRSLTPENRYGRAMNYVV
jgi:hypothetical protein